MARQGVAAERVLTFKVAGKSYSLPAATVIEVVRRPALTRVPHAPGALAGLMSYEGRAIPVIRMDYLLGESAMDHGDARIIVCDIAETIGLLVDTVLQLVEGSGQRKTTALDLKALLAAGYAPVTPARERVSRDAGVVATLENGEGRFRTLLSFRTAGQRFALPLAEIFEVARLPEAVAAMPRAGASVLGVADMRGTVVPLISLAGLMGLSGAGGGRSVVVTRLGTALVGLVVEVIERVERVAEGAIDAVPSMLRRGEDDAEIDGIARNDSGENLLSILSSVRLFGNRHVSQAIHDSTREATDLSQAVQAAEDEEQVLVFRLGAESYGLPIAAVDEIIQFPDRITRVPKAPEFVAGLASLRGLALPLIDQRRRFGTAEGGSQDRPRVIVLTLGPLRAGFIVDAVSQILRLKRSAIVPSPHLPGESRRLFDRVSASGPDGQLILLIDPAELLDKAERDILAGLVADRSAEAK